MKLKIKEIRRQKGFTLNYLHKITGYSVSHISEVENGKKKWCADFLMAVASALNVCPKELISCKLMACEECSYRC